MSGNNKRVALNAAMMVIKGRRHTKKSHGAPNNWIGEEEEHGNNVCVHGHKLQSELCLATAEEMAESVGQKCGECERISLKNGIELSLVAPEDPKPDKAGELIPKSNEEMQDDQRS